MEELGIPESTTEQIEALYSTAENAARKHVLAKAPSKIPEKLNTSMEAEGTKPVNLTVEIDMALSPQMKYFAMDELVGEAVEEALEASEKHLRKSV